MTSWLQREFGVFCNALLGLGTSFFKQLPSILLGLLVFAAFLIAGRVVRRLIITTGERTRLNTNLAQVLSRLASALITLPGICVAAVVLFPSFKPGDLVTGLGLTPLPSVSSSRIFWETFLRGF